MMKIDSDTLIKIIVGLATVVVAIIVALLGLYTQTKIKRMDYRAQARKDRAAQRLAFYVPLVRSCYEFDARIARILSSLHSDWLRSSHLDRIRQGEGFAQDPTQTGYFILSSLYVFACFFGWTEAIAIGVDATEHLAEMGRIRRRIMAVRRRIGKTGSRRAHPDVFIFDEDVLIVRRLFQFEELFVAYSESHNLHAPRDANKVHRHFQHSIGEMMLHRDNGVLRCKTFKEFFDEYTSNEQYRYWFAPLEALVTDLSDFFPNADLETQVKIENDIRPLRLLAIRYWCRVLIRNRAKELGIASPDPASVLEGSSAELKSLIEQITVEQLETHLAGRPKKQGAECSLSLRSSILTADTDRLGMALKSRLFAL
jgi:hypothetical protein